MANDLNRWTGIGRLGKDPELKSFPNGDAYCNLSIACGESWKDKTTGEKKERTEWANLVFLRKLAEIVGQYLKKGSKIYVEGSLRTRKWQDKEGNDRYTTEIVVQSMQMLDGKSDGAATPAARRAEPAAGRQPLGGDHFEDDDIPFAPRSWKDS